MWAFVFRLLSIIKRVTYTFEDRSNLADALLDVKEEYYKMHQGRNESLNRYYECFTNQISVMDEVHVNVVDPAMVELVATENEQEQPTMMTEPTLFNDL